MEIFLVAIFLWQMVASSRRPVVAQLERSSSDIAVLMPLFPRYLAFQPPGCGQR